MAFKTGSDQQVAYEAAKSTARALRQYCEDFNITAEANSISGNAVLDLYHRLISDDAIFDEAKQVDGIANYAKEIEEDPTYDVAAEFLAMQGSISDAITWIRNNYPTDASDWLQHQKFTASGISVRQFSPTATAGLRTEIQDIIDAIAEPGTTL